LTMAGRKHAARMTTPGAIVVKNTTRSVGPTMQHTRVVTSLSGCRKEKRTTWPRRMVSATVWPSEV